MNWIKFFDSSWTKQYLPLTFEIPQECLSWEETTELIELILREFSSWLYSKISEEKSEMWLKSNLVVPSQLTSIEKDLKEIEQEAYLSIAAAFGEIEEVQSIYVQKYRDEIQIFVLLSINQYNFDLMDKLLDLEYNIRKKYSEIVFEFFYPPMGTSEKKDFIHPQAICIYSKFQYGEL